MEQHEISVRIGKRTWRTIQHRIVEQTEEYHSLKHFVECSIRNNVGELAEMVAGSYRMLELIDLLNDVEHIHESPPELTAKARIKDENVSGKGVVPEVSRNTFSQINHVVDNVELDMSQVVRRCIFFELARLADQTGLLDAWEKNEIQGTCLLLKKELISIETRFYEILYRHFDKLGAETEKVVRLDPNFAGFAEYYSKHFYGTDTYQRIIGDHGERTMNCVENIIMEHTDYSFATEKEPIRLWS